MRSCRETSSLLSKSTRSRLTLPEWISLYTHLLMCKVCRIQRVNYLFVKQASKRILADQQLLGGLSSTAKKRIKATLLNKEASADKSVD